MSSKMPPAPPDQRSDKGPGSDLVAVKDETPRGKQVPSNLEQQDQEGNTRINTTTQGGRQSK